MQFTGEVQLFLMQSRQLLETLIKQIQFCLVQSKVDLVQSERESSQLKIDYIWNILVSSV